jgi:hypothetical protein
VTSVATGKEKTISGRLTLRPPRIPPYHRPGAGGGPTTRPGVRLAKAAALRSNPLRCGRGQLTLNAEKIMLGTTGSPSGFFTIKPRPGADPE